MFIWLLNHQGVAGSKNLDTIVVHEAKEQKMHTRLCDLLQINSTIPHGRVFPFPMFIWLLDHQGIARGKNLSIVFILCFFVRGAVTGALYKFVLRLRVEAESAKVCPCGSLRPCTDNNFVVRTFGDFLQDGKRQLLALQSLRLNPM